MKEGSHNGSENHSSEEELNIKEIVEVVWRGKSSTAIISSIFFLGAIIYALTATHLWTSSSVLTVVPDSSVGSSRSSAMSGLAGIAGISLSGANTGPDRTEIALVMIKSRDFLKHLLKFDNVLPGLMAVKSYDRKSKSIVYDQSIYRPTEGWVNQKPSYLEAMKKYNKILSVSINKKTQFLNISVTHPSPVFAKDLLTLILQETNSLRRERDLEEAEITLGYLYQELEQTQQVDIRLSINQLIESQVKTKMLARVKTNYLLEPLDLPYIPEERTSPRRTRIVLIATIAGLCFAMFLNLVAFYGFQRVNIVQKLDSSS